MRQILIAIIAFGLLAACLAPAHHIAIHPRDFIPHVANPWFPLRPGRTYVYSGTKDGKPARDERAVTNRTNLIQGVSTRVVTDKLFLDRKLEERTTSYYSDDAEGNVWFFGKDTADLDTNGNVTSTEETWRAGRDGQEPGIYVDTDP